MNKLRKFAGPYAETMLGLTPLGQTLGLNVPGAFDAMERKYGKYQKPYGYSGGPGALGPPGYPPGPGGVPPTPGANPGKASGCCCGGG